MTINELQNALKIYIGATEVSSLYVGSTLVWQESTGTPSANPLDILYSDANGNLSFTSEVLPASANKTPIGLCIAGTGFFGANEPARWMSLKFASNETPFTGKVEFGAKYGGYGTNLSMTDIQATHNGGSSTGYLTDFNNPYYEDTRTPLIPSLFNANNEWNISVLGTINSYAVTDIDGKNKTDILLQSITQQPNWQTDNEILCEENSGYAGPAACCARYHTLGTQEGDWYLGSIGEMCMIIVNSQGIGNILGLLENIYGENVVKNNKIGNDTFLTSTEYDSTRIYAFNPYSGYIDVIGKDSSGYVLPLLQWPSVSIPPHDYSQDYFTIESTLDSNTITAVKSSSTKNPTIYYSLDNGSTWSNQTLTSGTITFGTINTGDNIIFKSTDSAFANDWNKYIRFNGSKNFKVYGNIMSLTNGDNFASNSSFQANSSFVFCGLFYGTTTLVDASDLIFPATTLVISCYNGIFRGCSNLVNGPKLLPALDVPSDGYSSMFEGCVSLVEGPEISATTVSGNTALSRMFCMSRSSRVTAAMTKSPIIRITNPSSYNNVFQQLFSGNGNITEITILALGTNLSFSNWLLNANSSGVIKKPSATTLISGSANGIPSGWTTEDYIQ